MNQLWSFIVGGIVATAGGGVTAVLQARLQRQAARDEYMWSKRAELYLDIVRQVSGRVAPLDAHDVDDQYGWTPETDAIRRDLTARVQVFGSHNVEAAWGQLSEANRALDSYVEENLLVSRGEYAQVRSDAMRDPEYVRLLGKTQEFRNIFVDLVRYELRTESHLKQRL